MFRLLKYAPLALAAANKFRKSPTGQRAIANVKSRVNAKRNGGKH